MLPGRALPVRRAPEQAGRPRNETDMMATGAEHPKDGWSLEQGLECLVHSPGPEGCFLQRHHQAGWEGRGERCSECCRPS